MKIQGFIKNKKAVIELPMRLTVSIVIGTIALIAIFSYMLNPCLFPDKMMVSTNPLVYTVSGTDPADLDIVVNVTDTQGNPIQGAVVLIKGLKGIDTNTTSNTGSTNITITVTLEEEANEGYLGVNVKAACHETFDQQDLIKIVRQ